MANEKWTLSGQYMESCNCDYLCPCVYTNSTGETTNDNCTALLVFRIDDGRFGETRLDGLKFALVIRSGRVMAEGNWIFAGVVDAAADPAQREALTAIVSGEAGGTPALIRDHLVGDFRGVETQPIEFSADGLRHATSLGDVAGFEVEGVPSGVLPGEPLCIDNTGHPANPRLALARANAFHLHGFGLDLDLKGAGNNGHFAPFRWAA